MTSKSRRKLIFEAFTEGQSDCKLLSQSLDFSLSIGYRDEQFIIVGEEIQYKKGDDGPEFKMPLTTCVCLHLLVQGRDRVLIN